MGFFLNPLKHQKTRDFQMFSGVSKETIGMKWVSFFMSEITFQKLKAMHSTHAQRTN